VTEPVPLSIAKQYERFKAFEVFLMSGEVTLGRRMMEKVSTGKKFL
jgi:hypothetical protein